MNAIESLTLKAMSNDEAKYRVQLKRTLRCAGFPVENQAATAVLEGQYKALAKHAPGVVAKRLESLFEDAAKAWEAGNNSGDSRTLADGEMKCGDIQWIGISLDEAMRMKPARVRWLQHRWPLIEGNLTRTDCLAWMKARGFKQPPKSACSFCPYHDDNEWLRLKRDEPEAFQQAVEYEQSFQKTMASVTGFRGVPYLHRSLKPLSSVIFKATVKERRFQTNLNFTNECEGMCGV